MQVNILLHTAIQGSRLLLCSGFAVFQINRDLYYTVDIWPAIEENREHEEFHRRFGESGLEVTHIMSIHMPLDKAQSCPYLIVKGHWEILSGSVTRRKRKWDLGRTQQYLCHITSSDVLFQKRCSINVFSNCSII